MSRTVSLIAVGVISVATYHGLSNAQSRPGLSPLADACLNTMDSKEQVVHHCRALLASSETGLARARGAFRLGYHLGDDAWKEAIAAYTEAITHDPARLAAYHNRALLLANDARDYPAAIRDFTVVADRSKPGDKYDKKIWYLRGKAYQRNKQYSEAVADFERALKRNPDSTAMLYRLGYSQHRLGNRDAAQAAYARILEIKPDHPRALLRRAEVDFEAGNHDRALRDHIRAAQLAPDDSWINPRVDKFYDRLIKALEGRPGELITLAETALQFAPQEAALFKIRAMAQLIRQEFASAIEDIDAAIALEPQTFEYQFLRAVITLERGDTFDAIAQLDALLAQLGPDSDFIQELAIDGQRLLESGKHSWKVEGKIVDLIAVKDKARRLRESLSDW